MIFNKNWNLISGSVEFENGDTYSGSFQNQKFEGTGTYIWKETGSRYIGEFKNGACNGHGKLELYKTRGRVMKMIEGQFENNRIKKENVEKFVYMNMNIPLNKDFLKVPDMESEKFSLQYFDDKTTVEDIRAIISIESAYKSRYISKVDNFKEYRNFCNSLEIENVLNKRTDLILEALESFSLKELLSDILKTGSVSQRYIVIETIMKINFEFLIVFDSVRIAMINPYDRIMYRAANAATYKATRSGLIDEIKDVLMSLGDEIKLNESGPLIFDEMLLIIIQTGLLDLVSMLSVFKNISNIYEDLMIEEEKVFTTERSVFKRRFRNYAQRRIVLADTILQAAIQLRDFQILNEKEEVFNRYLRRQDYTQFKSHFELYFNDILTILINLFEDYVNNEFYGKDFSVYLDDHTNISEISLNISYVFMLIGGLISENYDEKHPEDLSSIDKDHVLKREFFGAKTKCKNSSFTFGFYLKENLENYDFGTIFKQVENCVEEGKYKQGCLNVQDLSEMLIPSIIACFSTYKKISQKYHRSLIMTLDEEFSIFQLNSEHTMNKFVKWLRKNDIKGRDDVSDWIDQRGLIYIDFTEYIRKTRKDHKDSKNIKIMNAIIKRIDSINNVKKGIKLSHSYIEIVKIDNIKDIAKVRFRSDHFNPGLPIERNLRFVDDMTDNEYNFLITLLEIRFEYIALPKFLLRNSSITNFNLEKYNTLHLYTKDILNDPETNPIMRREILHALITGYTIKFRNFNINDFAADLTLYMTYFKPKITSCSYSRDFVYLISLISAKIWFSETDALGFNIEGELKDDDIDAFKLVNRVIKKCKSRFKKEDTELIMLEEIEEEQEEKNKKKEAGSAADLFFQNNDVLNNQLEETLSDGEDETDLHADSNMNAMRLMKRQKTSFRIRMNKSKGVKSNDGKAEYPLQWTKLSTVFLNFQSLVENAKQMFSFDVDKALNRMERGESIIHLTQKDDTPSSAKMLRTNTYSFTKGENSLSIAGMDYSRDFTHQDEEKRDLLRKKKRYDLQFQRAKGQRNGTPYHQPSINADSLESSVLSRFAQRVIGETQIRILARHLTKATSIFYDDEDSNIKKILDGDSTSLKMITIAKETMEKSHKLQRIIVSELKKRSDERKGIKGMIKSTILMYLSQKSKKFMNENRVESSYLDSYAYYWLLRKDINYFIKNISENNNMSGKLLFYKLEPSTNLMKLYLRDLQTNLEKNKRVDKSELALQKWKLEQLQELCVGPCIKNQRYMTQREYLSLYDFKFLNRNIPLDAEHPKFKRDLSLVDFYQSVIEGGNLNIVSKVRLQIKPEEILSYIKTLLLILEANWSHASIEDLKEKLIKRKAKNVEGLEGGGHMMEREINMKIKKFKSIHIRSSKILPQSQLTKKEKEEAQKNPNSFEGLKYYINSQFLTDMISNLTYDGFRQRCIQTRYGESIIYDLIVSSYLLMIRLSDHDPFKKTEIIEKDHASNLLRVFMSNMRAVELTNMTDQSEVIVFPLVSECQQISTSVMKKIMEDFDPHNPTGLFYNILLEINNTRKVLNLKVSYKEKYGLIYQMIKNKTVYA